jgi:hypothetical protein
VVEKPWSVPYYSVRFPILPTRRTRRCRNVTSADACAEETWEAPHFSMFAPRDFDVSPYFTVIKPPPVEDFDYARARWAK